MSGAFHRVCGSSVASLGKLVETRFQTIHGRCTKHTAICSPASVAKENTSHPRCLASPEKNWNSTISYLSPVDCVTLRSSDHHAGRTIW